MFIVLLAITMLMGIGVFAARSASQTVLASGYKRQQTQTHYLAEYALLTALAELRSDRREGYVNTMAGQPDSNCQATKASSSTRVTNPSCYRFLYSTLDAVVNADDATHHLLTASSGSTPGSLGLASISPNFVVELSDLAPAPVPIAGYDLSGSGGLAVRYMTAMLTAQAQVRPYTAGSTLDVGSARVASSEYARGRVLLGPFPR